MKNEITKRDVLNAIIAMAEAQDGDEFAVDEKIVTANDIVAYAEKAIDQLAAKAAKAKENAAKKRTDEDALYVAVEGVLDENFKTIDEIVAAIPEVVGDEGKEIEVTRPKVVARLNKIVKAGNAHKTQVKIDTRKVVAYAAGPAPVEADAE